jgi:hypothetical protein
MIAAAHPTREKSMSTLRKLTPQTRVLAGICLLAVLGLVVGTIVGPILTAYGVPGGSLLTWLGSTALVVSVVGWVLGDMTSDLRQRVKDDLRAVERHDRLVQQGRDLYDHLSNTDQDRT